VPNEKGGPRHIVHYVEGGLGIGVRNGERGEGPGYDVPTYIFLTQW